METEDIKNQAIEENQAKENQILENQDIIEETLEDNKESEMNFDSDDSNISKITIKPKEDKELTPEEIKAKVEAVLFITSRAMQPSEIAQIISLNEELVENALLDLMFDYSSRNSALEIDDEDGYIIQVRAEHMDIVEKLCPVELSPAILKTLTVIALKEPIRQTTLKELRSSAYEHINVLLEQGLISRSKDKNGRSFNIRTTKKFQEYFKLKGDIKALVKRLDATQDLKNL